MEIYIISLQELPGVPAKSCHLNTGRREPGVVTHET